MHAELSDSFESLVSLELNAILFASLTVSTSMIFVLGK